MEWTVQELARRAGVSGRTLRHYHQIGLLVPDRVGSNGYRYYSYPAVQRLQRILLLRAAGMSLAAIAESLAQEGQDGEAELAALEDHLAALERERAGLERRIAAVRGTLDARRQGRDPDIDVMLDGFNDRYEEQVVERWGRDAYQQANDWWHAKTFEQQRDWKTGADELVAEWRELHRQEADPTTAAAQQVAQRHVAWLAAIPGTPTHARHREQSLAMVCGLATLYATDPNFVHTYGGQATATFVSDVLTHWVEAQRANQ